MVWRTIAPIRKKETILQGNAAFVRHQKIITLYTVHANEVDEARWEQLLV